MSLINKAIKFADKLIDEENRNQIIKDNVDKERKLRKQQMESIIDSTLREFDGEYNLSYYITKHDTYGLSNSQGLVILSVCIVYNDWSDSFSYHGSYENNSFGIKDDKEFVNKIVEIVAKHISIYRRKNASYIG